MVRQASFNQGYEIREEEDRRVVSFRGDGLPWSAWIIFPLVFLGVSILFFTPLWIVPVVVIGGLGCLSWLTIQPQQFALTPTGIIKAGKAYDFDRVSEVLIDNPMDKSVSITAHPGFVVGGMGIAGASVAAVGTLSNAASNAMMGAAMANARAAAKRRFRVRIRYGSQVVTLARNMKKDHALSIFNLLAA